MHRSEIVRRGLQATLKKYFNIEITLLSSPGDLSSFSGMTYSQIILFAGSNELKEMKSVREFENSVVEIADQDSNPAVGPDKKQITLNTTGDQIHKMVSEILNARSGIDSEPGENGELTAREKDVLKLVALGNANKEIAEKLFISVHTVISHRKNITEKLGIKSISGLTVYAIMNKIIDPGTIDPEQLI